MRHDLEQLGYGGNGVAVGEGAGVAESRDVIAGGVEQPLALAVLSAMPLIVEWDVSHSGAVSGGVGLAKLVWTVSADSARCGVVGVDGQTRTLDGAAAAVVSVDAAAGLLHVEACGGAGWLKATLEVGPDGKPGRLLFARTGLLESLGIRGGRAEIPTFSSGFGL